MGHALSLPAAGPLPAPWQRLKADHRAAFLRDLVSEDCCKDVVRSGSASVSEYARINLMQTVCLSI